MKKISKNRANLGRIMIILGGLGCMLCSAASDPTMWLCAVAVLFIGLILYFRHNRCPRCGGSLAGKASGSGFCPKCGVKLEIGK